MNNKYKSIWLAFVDIIAENKKFAELIDVEGSENNSNYSGAWTNILIKAATINEAIEIIPLGLKELGFKIDFIDKIENVMSLIENNELNKKTIKEVNWLLSSNYVFKISDKIFPYEND